MISPGSGLLPQSLTARNCVAVSATARRAMSSNHVPTMRTTHHRGDLPPAVGTGLAAGRPCGSQPARVAVLVAVHRRAGGSTRDQPRRLVQVEPIWTIATRAANAVRVHAGPVAHADDDRALAIG